MSCTLHELSTELLIKIFYYLDVVDLCKLKQTCKRFKEIINCWDHVLLKSITPLVTNQKSVIFLSRCSTKLTTLEKIRISINWQIGKYSEKAWLFVRHKYIPGLHLSKKSIWVSRGSKIFNYARYRNQIYDAKPRILLKVSKTNADIGNFQLKNDLLLSGQRDGSLWLWHLSDLKVIFDARNCHDSDINAVDISSCGNIIASGSRDNCLKIWRLNYESSDVLNELHCHVLQDRVWKVSLSNDKPLLAVGTSGNKHISPLYIYDIDRIADPTELPSTRLGCGVLDIKWDGPNTLWSCGYDTFLRRWDLRTGRCEQIYRDPHASALYCLDYDYFNTIMTGTQMHGRVILWDIRKSNCVQLYFMASCKNTTYRRSSPIYSLQFDSECLFTATDQDINVLDFSAYNGIVNDYSYCCK